MLPSSERRQIDSVKKKELWLYGAPFTGKTYFANKFPKPLMLNTDGNIKFVDAPYVAIKNEVTMDGRITKTKLAWVVFKDIIGELEKNQNDFETIIVDLLEDTYEHCRLYIYEKLGIEHESDNSFKAWDMVRTEFLSTLKRLINLDYNIVLISHEDTSKDITKKTGDKITRIAPNIQEKTANKIAGMVDIVARVVGEDDERFLSFKTSEVEFGGGRLTLNVKKISLDYEEFIKIYDAVQKETPATKRERRTTEVAATVNPVAAENPIPEEDVQIEESVSESPSEPARRTRRSRTQD